MKLFCLPTLLLAAPAALPQDDPAARARELVPKVEELRKLKFRKEVRVGVYTPEETRAFLRADLQAQMSPETFKAVERTLKIFGAIPKDLDFRKAYLDLSTDAVGGFYHLRTKELRLVKTGKDPGTDGINRWMKKEFGVTMDDIVLAHELCHAAQDQAFDLQARWPLSTQENNDLVLGLESLMEGDANLFGWYFGLRDALDRLLPRLLRRSKQRPKDEEGLRTEFIRRSLRFPYGYGTAFVYEIWKAGGRDWAVVNRLYEDPPLSSEQVLHIEKYLDRDPPQRIVHDGLKTLMREWTPLRCNVLGELQLWVLLQRFGIDGAERIAAGWDGDRYWTYQRGESVFCVWFSTWDSEADAKEFEAGWRAVLRKKYGERAEDEASIERRGADVLVVERGSPELRGKVRAMWSGFRKTELRRVPKPGK